MLLQSMLVTSDFLWNKSRNITLKSDEVKYKEVKTVKLLEYTEFMKELSFGL